MSLNTLFNQNRNPVRNERWIVRDMQVIAQQHLQRVLAQIRQARVDQEVEFASSFSCLSGDQTEMSANSNAPIIVIAAPTV